MQQATADADPNVARTFPLRAKAGGVGWLIFLAQLGWSIPNNAATTLLQSASVSLAPGHKLQFYALLTTVGAVAAVVGVVLGGALSDRTRSRFGKRLPWILGAGAVAALGLFTTGLPIPPIAVIGAFCVFQAALNATVASINALIPDYFAPAVFGRVSALGGAGVLLGTVVGSLGAAAFVTVPRIGLMIVPWTIVVAAVVVAALLPRRSSRDEPRAATGAIQFLLYLRPPKDRQFWWVFAGRFLFILALFMTVQYQFYIATDYLGLGAQAAGDLLALCSLVLALSAGAATLITGPLSDRWGRKVFIIAASAAVIVGMIPLLVADRPWALLVAFGFGGAAYGAYLSVDAALTIDALPTQRHVAKDLAVLNASNSLPLLFAPGLAGLLVSQLGYRASFTATIVLAAAAAVCVLFVRRVR